MCATHLSHSAKATIVVQLRISSKRLPKKILLKVQNKTIIEHLFRRLLLAKLPIILATPFEQSKHFHFLMENLSSYLPPKGCVFENNESIPKVSLLEGEEENVLDRYLKAASIVSTPIIIRVTADNPFTSIRCLLKLLSKHDPTTTDLSYYEGLPYGVGVEIVTRKSLLKLSHLNTSAYEKEHVSAAFYVRNKKFRIVGLAAPADYKAPLLRVTVDTQEYFEIFKNRLEENNALIGKTGVLSLKKLIESSKTKHAD